MGNEISIRAKTIISWADEVTQRRERRKDSREQAGEKAQKGIALSEKERRCV